MEEALNLSLDRLLDDDDDDVLHNLVGSSGVHYKFHQHPQVSFQTFTLTGLPTFVLTVRRTSSCT